jgi:hypothetical protein
MAITLTGGMTLGAMTLSPPPPPVPNYSVVFNGSSQYLTTPASASYITTTGDYTIEFWCYSLSLGSGSAGCMFYVDKGGYQILMRHNGPVWETYYAQGSRFEPRPTTTDIPINQWNHQALVRIGGTVKWYINGTQYGSAADTTSYNSTTFTRIGEYASYYYDGYISNLRVVNGTGVYNSAFTPSTTGPLPATQGANTYGNPSAAISSGTSLLTCQSSTIIDNSTNAFTITNTGTATVSSTNPFP